MYPLNIFGSRVDPVPVQFMSRERYMIYVFASVRVRRECLGRALDCYRELVPAVLQCEPGCLEYVPTVDVDMGLSNQEKDACLILVAERWRSLEDFRAHLGMPHSAVFRASMEPLLAAGITVRVAQSAL